MNRDQALRLLELGPDTPETEVEAAYQQQRDQLLELLDSVSLKASAREQLSGRLAALDAAMAALRVQGRSVDGDADEADFTRILDADLTVVDAAAEPPLEDDPDATRFAWIDPDQPESNQTTVQPFIATTPGEPAARPPPAPASQVKLIAPLLVLALIAGWFLLRPADENGVPGSETEPVVEAVEQPPAAADSVDKGLPGVRDASARWQVWGDRLQDEQLRLATIYDQAREESLAAAATIDSRTTGSAEDHPARERLRLIESKVVDGAYLKMLERTLAKPLPATTAEIDRARNEFQQLVADAQQRQQKLEALDLALAERQPVRAQLARLRAAGLPRWPPTPGEFENWFQESEPAEVARAVAATRAADAAFREADYGLAAQRYKRAAARLTRLDVTRVETPDETNERIAELYELGREAIERNRLSLPADASALYYALEIETLKPGRREAAELMAGIQERYIVLAESQLARGEPARARRYADLAVATGAEEADVAGIRQRAAVLQERQFQPRKRVVEVEGMEMIALPLGEFTMGAKSSALEDFAGNIGTLLGSLFGNDDTDYSGGQTEVPAHRVVIDTPVAISRFEVTVAQFRRFISSSGYRTDAELHGYSYVLLDDREVRLNGKNWRHNYLGKPASEGDPVIHVSQRDAQAYARWLSEATGARYRLPSESEFEYAARAGTARLLPWSGGTPPEESGNFRGQQDSPPPGWRSADNLRAVPRYGDGYFGPAPVGSFRANAYGYADMLGNVAEWVADCFQPDYADKGPAQGPRRDGDCGHAVVRDTAWSSDARLLRLSYRERRPVTYSSNTVGFRVARDILPAAR